MSSMISSELYIHKDVSIDDDPKNCSEAELRCLILISVRPETFSLCSHVIINFAI